MADSLQRQIKQLADLSRVQQRFVSDVSHELRTPLTTIRLAGDVLYDQRETFPPATARTAELLHAQTQRFELLLADLLEMSRYDAGAVTLETEPTNIVHLVEGAIDAVAPLAAEKQTELRLVAPGGYFEAEVDSRRIRRILQNLLGNAIDHGEGKPIVVYVDSNADAVAIAVRDYGVGMSAVDMARVFDRFWRADPSRQRSTGRNRARPRDLARGRHGARRRARGLVGGRRRQLLPPHPPAGHGARRCTGSPSTCRRTPPSSCGRRRDRERARGGRACVRSWPRSPCAALLLTGCVGLPTGGGVSTEEIDSGVDDPSQLRARPSRRRPARRPRRSSQGFIRAGRGPQDGYRVAREFLTDDFRARVEAERRGHHQQQRRSPRRRSTPTPSR